MQEQTTTWDDVDEQLGIFLDDEDGDKYETAQRVIAWNWAQRELAIQHTPRQCVIDELTVEAGSRSATLPADAIEIWKIYDADYQRWWRKMPTPRDGAVRYDDDNMNQYWSWGGKLYMEREVSATEAKNLIVYYWGYWPEVVYETISSTVTVVQEEILVPPWATFALCHLTAAIVLTPLAIQAARRRDFNIRVDSGTPIDNSRAQQAREHLWWWQELLGSKLPRYGRG